MKIEDLGAIRIGAELQSVKPYMDSEIFSMQKAVVSFILTHVNAGTLTPEMAVSKWVEYISYTKLQQKIDQRIEIGKSKGGENYENLTFTAK